MSLHIVLFGPPGAGKGTQSEKIVKKYDLVHTSTGDMLREEVKLKSPIGMRAKKIMEMGILVSDNIVTEMIENRLKKYPDSNGFIFDGFPRTITQAEMLNKILKNYEQKIQAVISLEIDKKEIVERLLKRGKDSQRKDDRSKELILKRITEYEGKTNALKTFYKKEKNFYPINGIGSEEEIFKNIEDIISHLHKNS